MSADAGHTTHNARLQRGLDPARKSVRVANYASGIEHEVKVIAHSCGVQNPRQLKRFHARIVTAKGISVPLSEMYPEPKAGEALSALEGATLQGA